MNWNMSKRMLGVLVIFLSLLSCEKNDTPDAIDKATNETIIRFDDLTIINAKSWFERVYTIEAKNNETEKTKGLIRKAHWESSYLEKMSNGQDMVVVPLEHHDKDKPANIDTYLWVFIKDGKFSGKVIEYLSYSLTDSKAVNFREFSGAMVIKDWNGELLNGFTFKKGVATGVLESVDGEIPNVIKDGKALKTKGVYCEDVYITYSNCNQYYYYVCVNGDCTDPVENGTFCETTSFRVLECRWVADFPGDTDPYSGSGGYNNAPPITSPSQVHIPGMDKPSIDPYEYMKCFLPITPSSTYRITIYIDEPVPGTDKLVDGFNVGHTFIGLEKHTNGVITRQIVGFYPDYPSFGYVDSNIKDNGGSDFTVSTTYDGITPSDFATAIDAILNQQTRKYHISNYNCTTAAADICNAVGLTFPQNTGDFPFLLKSGQGPGKAGYDLRGYQSSGTLNINGGKAPTSKGPCN